MRAAARCAHALAARAIHFLTRANRHLSSLHIRFRHRVSLSLLFGKLDMLRAGGRKAHPFPDSGRAEMVSQETAAGVTAWVERTLIPAINRQVFPQLANVVVKNVSSPARCAP